MLDLKQRSDADNWLSGDLASILFVSRVFRMDMIPLVVIAATSNGFKIITSIHDSKKIRKKFKNRWDFGFNSLV